MLDNGAYHTQHIFQYFSHTKFFDAQHWKPLYKVQILPEDLDMFHICGFQVISVHFLVEFWKAYTYHVNCIFILQLSMLILMQVYLEARCTVHHHH